MQVLKQHSTHGSARRTNGLRSKVLTLAVGAALGATAIGAPQVFSNTPSTVASQAMLSTATTPGFATMAEQVRPAVVHISVRPHVSRIGGSSRQGHGIPPQLHEFMERFGMERFGGVMPPTGPNMPGHPGGQMPAQGIGSGFIISKSGYIVTNHHVLGDADEATVTLEDGTELVAKVKGSDPKTDLALLKVDADGDLPFVSFGDSHDTRVGDWVVAVGSPFGLGGTFSAGIVSARGRDIRSGPYDDFIQTDASINRGNSGGPLFNAAGEVIGVNTAIFSPTGGNVGIGFAVPASLAGPVIEQLKSDGRVDRGRLGVNIQTLDEDLAKGLGIPETEGALIASVEPGSAAEKAGLRAGDVITTIDGEQMADSKSVARRVGSHRQKDTLKLSLLRDGKPVTVEVTLGGQPGTLAGTTSKGKEVAAGTPRVGAMVADLTPEVRSKWNIDEGVQGAVIAKVDPDGPAAARRLRPGDVIVQVGRSPVKSAEEVVSAIQEAGKSDDRVVLRVNREGENRFVAVDLQRG